MLRESSFSTKRPTLGSTTETILAGWKRACEESSAQASRVRALLTIGGVGEWEFCWQDETLHRLLGADTSRPATAGEQELLRRCITYGWFFVYQQPAAGQEPILLHAVGGVLQESLSQGDQMPQQENEEVFSGVMTMPPLSAPPDRSFWRLLGPLVVGLTIALSLGVVLLFRNKLLGIGVVALLPVFVWFGSRHLGRRGIVPPPAEYRRVSPTIRP